MKINSDEHQHVIFARQLQSALRLMVGLMDIYCELQQICHFCVKNFVF